MNKNKSLIVLIIINIIVFCFVLYSLINTFDLFKIKVVSLNQKSSNKKLNEKKDIEDKINQENNIIITTFSTSNPQSSPTLNPENISTPMPTQASDSVEKEVKPPTLPTAGKPVIYLYPTKIQDVSARLDTSCKLDVTYPQIINGTWNITAFPDGKIINKADNREYSYLFWEGSKCNVNYDLSSGFIVEGSKTREFLQEKLTQIGLIPKEYNEFIVYWLPFMQNNKYNLIHFAGKQYQDSAKLEIIPKPDSILRVFMVYKALENPINIKPQNFQKFSRNGFAVVEWGGTEVK